MNKLANTLYAAVFILVTACNGLQPKTPAFLRQNPDAQGTPTTTLGIDAGRPDNLDALDL